MILYWSIRRCYVLTPISFFVVIRYMKDQAITSLSLTLNQTSQENVMAKGMDRRTNAKKKPAKTMMEKRAEKAAKKRGG